MSLRILFSMVFCCVLQTATAKELAKDTDNTATKPAAAQGPFSHLWYGALGAYTDFKFNSTAGNNYNTFKGYSKLAAIGGNNIVLAPSWTLGVSLFKVETHVGSKMFLSPGIPSASTQSTKNNTLYAHVMKQFNANYFLDLAAAYGFNKVNTSSILVPGSKSQQIGYASSHSSNWFATVTGLYTKPWKKWVVSANARLLYSEVSTGSYPFFFQTQLPTQIVEPLSNQSWFLMENVELSTHFDRTPELTPFVNAGLVQVIGFHNSRPLVGVPINGLSPQLNLDKNGFRVGGGLGYTRKQFTIRIEEQYYNAGSTYSSYQTLLGIKYALA